MCASSLSINFLSRTAIPGDLPRRLNTRSDLYGKLEEPLDLTLGFEDNIKTRDPATGFNHYSITSRRLQRQELRYKRFQLANLAATSSKAMLKTTISSGKDTIKVLYAAEIGAIDQGGNFVELKTTSNGYQKWLKNNSLNWYLQSYLGKVTYIVRGTKYSWNHPIVYRTDRTWTRDIPKMAVIWNKDTCFEALFGILRKIESKLEYDDEALVVKITRGEEVSFVPEYARITANS